MRFRVVQCGDGRYRLQYASFTADEWFFWEGVPSAFTDEADALKRCKYLNLSRTIAKVISS